MSEFELRYEWEDPGGVAGAELAATWARLEIYVGDNCITELVDWKNRATREGIYLPLYPMAEWIAQNWWSLLYELHNPARNHERSFAKRHNLMFVGDGYALPNVAFLPSGATVEIIWKQSRFEFRSIKFLSSGHSVITREALQDTFRAFIQAVIDRLESMGILDTYLQTEWLALGLLNEDEQEFSRAAAALGLNPFAVRPKEEKAILAAAKNLPRDIWYDYFSIADRKNMNAEIDWIVQSISKLDNVPTGLEKLLTLRQTHRSALRRAAQQDAVGLPWQRGRRVARTVRRILNLDGLPINGIDSLIDVLSDDKSKGLSAVISGQGPIQGVDAIVSVPANKGPRFLITKFRADSRCFVFCRALHDILTYQFDEVDIIYGSYSDQQKQNRTFAAEFLAPAIGLRERLKTRMVEHDTVADLAEEFGVSTWVIEYQIQNNNLGKIITPSSKELSN